MFKYVSQLHILSKYSHMPNMPRGRTSPGLAYMYLLAENVQTEFR